MPHPLRQAKLLKSATHLRDKYLKCTAVQTTLERSILEDSAYECANNPVQKSKFDAPKKLLKDTIDAESFFIFL